MATTSHQVEDRVSFDGALCTIRYVGEVEGTSGVWLGVEWDDPSRGKHTGRYRAIRYFQCRSNSPTAASFVRPSRRTDEPQGFLSALQEKYASEGLSAEAISTTAAVEISGKVVEEVGFDKVRRKLAQVHELRIVILDGMRIAYAGARRKRIEDADMSDGVSSSIRQACPKVTELDLSRNLFTDFGTVVEICSGLEELKSLRLNGNRLREITAAELEGADRAFRNVKELALDETLMGWEEICLVASRFPMLRELRAGTNQFSSLSSSLAPCAQTLTSLTLEYNDFRSLSDLGALTALSSLRNLHLKGNNISSLASPSSPSAEAPSFATFLHYLDISYNQVGSWAFLDALPQSFPGLTSLRLAHNPIYDRPEDSSSRDGPQASSKPTGSGVGGGGTAATEEAFMITVARLRALQSLNFSAIAPADRINAEAFYLSRIARELAAVPAASPAEKAVLARHPRWAELCAQYGEPEVVRRQGEVNPAFLEARLVRVVFVRGSDGGNGHDGAAAVTRTAEVPRSFDIYRVKSIVGKLFGCAPRQTRLIWETGEWDPVAGFDDETGVSSDEEDGEEAEEQNLSAAARTSDDVVEGGGDEAVRGRRRAGKWVKREVELKDGPRLFGFCVDGPAARIRVEIQSG